MARVIGLLVGLLVAGFPCANSLMGQDFLKQLENRLKDATGKKLKETPPEPSQSQEIAPDEPASEPADEPADEAMAEELPVPGGEPPVQAKPRPAPIILFPKKDRDPSRSASPVVPAEPEAPEGGYLGLTLEPLPGGNFGLAVVEVAPQSPAWKSGFRIGDRVIGVEGQAVTTMDQFASALQSYPPGEPIKFLVQRQGRTVNLTSILQDRGIAQRLQGNVLRNVPRRPLTPYQPISGATGNEEGMVLGVSVSNLSEAFRQQFGIPVYRGASISEVVVGSPAERAGLQPGDCIVDIDGRMVLFAEDVVQATRGSVPGQTMLIGFYRGSQKMRAEVGLATDRASNARGETNHPVDGETISPEYVAGLHAEIDRLREELETMQRRVQDLESRLPSRRR
jgi:membrane-associated protease RseP (regulator of RpoE activity)